MSEVMKSPFKRMATARFPWICALIATLLILLAFVLKTLFTSGGLLDAPALEQLGWSCMRWTGTLCALFASQFVAKELASGELRALLDTPARRTVFPVACLLSGLLYIVICLLVLMLPSAGYLFATGQLGTFPDADTVVQWLAQIVLVLLAYYAVMIALGVLISNDLAVLVVNLLLVLGFFEAALSSAAHTLVPAAGWVPTDTYLMAALNTLMTGGVNGAVVYVQAGVTILVALAVAMVCMRQGKAPGGAAQT